ncbi:MULTISPECIES: holo-ACP synthase [Halomonas]|uniref:Holo-[acyl-carrier-protein] synthase n=3 Tax=Halomonas TaxID=2745 RepID=A0AAU7KLW2_9GAMM|nr:MULTISPECIES: holo-ACP synthase [Halomonas]MBR9769694.1 holo-ACP synthase [Gammaproteobacteria bacterium]MAR70843.1 holo-ACP synthase [Halomonas sp.]MBR9878784.1 holo-ACP synthase [Gammaproteobacteria bacterium]MBS8268863.1 holo-ACP synthase [Halomonas litopenaei]MBY5942037.1 holo-ACP synthase [Halomonas sp. DP5N14-9]|tara:strand:+ start:5566 stop:5946 length:381 start_codon:yes stop_codon:yes gene_type:complete
MILGIGTDIARIERFDAAIARHGARFAERILGPLEAERYTEAPRPSAFLAKRFAAKEAWLKALGTGLRHGMRWTEIQVVNDPLGRPELVVSGEALRLADQAGVGACHLSLSDESDVALAFVVLERR